MGTSEGGVVGHKCEMGCHATKAAKWQGSIDNRLTNKRSKLDQDWEYYCMESPRKFWTDEHPEAA